MTTIAVIAKECVPGRVKTRLSPPFTPAEAARLAAASLDDTLLTVRELPATRRLLYYDGDRRPSTAREFEVMAQVDGDLDERLAHLFDVVSEPLLLLGMDTPQVGHTDVVVALDLAGAGAGGGGGSRTDADCWLGPAADGGFWALAMREPLGDLIRGVAMSRADTGEAQHRRLEEAGLVVGWLPRLADVDTAADAAVIANEFPGSRFAGEYRRIMSGRQA